MVEKTLFSVVITLTCGGTQTFADSATSDAGTAAYQQLGHDIRIVDGATEVFIPWDAVCKAEVTKTVSQEAYQDDMCN